MCWSSTIPTDKIKLNRFSKSRAYKSLEVARFIGSASLSELLMYFDSRLYYAFGVYFFLDTRDNRNATILNTAPVHNNA